MSETGLLLILNTGAQIVLFGLALLTAALAARVVTRYAKATAAATADGAGVDQAITGFPVAKVFAISAAAVLFLMAALSANVWLPKVDNTPPAVNATMQGQMYRDAERVIVIDKVAPETFEDEDAERAETVDEMIDSFKSLPDDK